MNKIAAFLVAGCLSHAAYAASLTSSDTNLGRVKATAVKNGLSVSVDIGDDVPTSAHVIARFQNNQPLMLGRDGLWAPWNGDQQRIDAAAFVLTGKKITFPIFDKLPDGLFYPVSFTVIYRTDAGLKSGTVTVDGP